MPIDYSKWKDIEVSDDEDDTHPNVDTPSLFRWRHQARVERMAEKKHEKEEVEHGKTDSNRKIREIEEKLEKAELDEKERRKLELELSDQKKQEEEWRKKEEELAEKERLEPWNVDTIGHEAFSKSRINKYSDKAAEEPKKATTSDEYEDASKTMRAFFDANEELIEEYGKLKDLDATEAFLLENPHIADDNTANYLTIEALNAGMEFKEEEVARFARQTIIVQYLLELAKSLRAVASNENVIRNFFKKFKAADPTYLRLYEQEVTAFEERIKKRAKEKRDAAIAEYEAEQRQERLKQAPGGLDPQEVYENLPEEMREAFDSQDIAQLQAVALKIDKEIFAYHLKRCIDSGLWIPDANKKDGDDDEVEEERGDGDSAVKSSEQAGDAAESSEPKKDR